MRRVSLCIIVFVAIGCVLTGCGGDGESAKPVTGLDITMDSADVEVSHTVSIGATVSGGETKKVKWCVNDILGGGSTLGTITQTNPAIYTAPDEVPVPAAVMVKAVSEEDAAEQDTCRVTICFTTVYVDGVAGNDDASTGSVSSPLASIAKGLDVSRSGMTVQIASGTYHEHDLDMKGGVTLRGDPEHPENVTIDADALGRVIDVYQADTTTVIEGLKITGGHAVGEHSENHGGGMRLRFASPIIRDCIFEGNSAYSSGGALALAEQASVEAVNCVFKENSALTYGGAVYYLSGFDGAFENCTFCGNASGTNGGAVLCTGDIFIKFTSCTFCGNSAGTVGGGIYTSLTPSVTFENTIIAFSTHGDGVYQQEEASVLTFTCCDIYGNEGGDWIGSIAGSLGVDGNFSQDPLFCDMATCDLRLHSSSPCLPGQHPSGYACGLIGAWGSGCP